MLAHASCCVTDSICNPVLFLLLCDCVLQGKHKGKQVPCNFALFSSSLCFHFLSWEDNAIVGCRNNIKMVVVHMGFVFPTAPAHLRAMLPCVAWPPVTGPGSDKILAPSRCDNDAKHKCPTDKARKHRKPAMAESLDSASSSSSDMPPLLQPATSEAGATLESSENMSRRCDTDPSHKEPPTATEPTSLNMQHPPTPAVHDNTETAATRSPDSTFSTTWCEGSKPAKGAEPCKSHNPNINATDQLPSDLPPRTETIAVKSPMATRHIAAAVDEHYENPLTMSPDCSITKYTKGATPKAVSPVAGTTVTAAVQHQGQPVTPVEDASWLDDLDNGMSPDPIQSILQLLPDDLAFIVQARLDGPSSSR